MVPINKKPVIDTQRIEKKRSKHDIKESHQLTRERNKGIKRNREELQRQAGNNKMAINTFLAIII